MFTISITVPDRSFDLRLELDPRQSNEATVLRALQRGELYEPDVALAMIHILRPGDSFVDVGANLGFFSALAGHLVGPSGRGLAFEPDPRNRARLEVNLGANELRNVVVSDRVAGERAGPVPFFLNRDDSGGSALWDPGLYPGNDASRANPSRMMLTGTTLDAALAEQGMVPRLVKIDTEGAEHAVLTGAAGLLGRRAVPYVIAELHEFGLERLGSSQQALRALMKGFGYDTFALYQDGSLPKLIPPGTRLQPRFIINLLFSTQERVVEAWPVELFNALATGSA